MVIQLTKRTVTWTEGRCACRGVIAPIDDVMVADWFIVVRHTSDRHRHLFILPSGRSLSSVDKVTIAAVWQSSIDCCDCVLLCSSIFYLISFRWLFCLVLLFMELKQIMVGLYPDTQNWHFLLFLCVPAYLVSSCLFFEVKTALRFKFKRKFITIKEN